MDKPSALLRRTARICGISLSYTDDRGKSVPTTSAGLEMLLRALEPQFANQETISDATLSDFIQRRRQSVLKQSVKSILTAWGGQLKPLWLWSRKAGPVTVQIHSWDQAEKYVFSFPHYSHLKRNFNGKTYFRIQLNISQDIPFGYYDILVSVGAREIGKSYLISAPENLPTGKKGWGIFAPVYALKSDIKQSDIGDFDDLADAARFVRSNGGAFIGTLPLLPIAYENGEKSPYSPTSRLFLNEIYLPDDASSPVTDIVDYKSTYQRKYASLVAAAQDFFKDNPDGNADFQGFSKTKDYLHEYAAYRAQSSDNPEEALKTHLYAQYLCHKKLLELKASSDCGESAVLYLDFPIGVAADGFDSSQFSHLFIDGVSVGAPPDHIFGEGQNWGFKPFHPQNLIEDRFAYLRLSLKNYFSYANMIRLDHIMGFYRIFCIPNGSSASDGAYIHYPFDAIMAVLCLEAFNHNAAIIGEDLGTVPQAVQEAMEKRGLHRMWLSQFEIKETPEQTFAGIKSNMLACMNTHDLFPLQSFITLADCKKLAELKLMAAEQADSLAEERKLLLAEWEIESLFLKFLNGMARSPARFVMVNIEDLWGETEPQNVPGAKDCHHPNWQRRLKFSLSQWKDQDMFEPAIKILADQRG